LMRNGLGPTTLDTRHTTHDARKRGDLFLEPLIVNREP
jgi:hypothetical protein